MRWFKKKEEDVDIDQAILEARAKLAMVQELPTSDFTMWPSPRYPFIRHGVDEKPAEIARIKGKIAWLETIKRGTEGGEIQYPRTHQDDMWDEVKK